MGLALMAGLGVRREGEHWEEVYSTNLEARSDGSACITQQTSRFEETFRCAPTESPVIGQLGYHTSLRGHFLYGPSDLLTKYQARSDLKDRSNSCPGETRGKGLAPLLHDVEFPKPSRRSRAVRPSSLQVQL